MFDALIAFSLRNRLLVLVGALLLLVYGIGVMRRMPVDVLPDLDRPTVTVLSEAHGLAPEEVEQLVTTPLEQAVNGAPGVTGIRSTSGLGLSVLQIQFGWGADVFRARQTVNERLQLARERLPAGVEPQLGPISSIMGEVMLVGVVADSGVTPMQLRTLADVTLRPRLLSIPGVSQVVPIGGRVEQIRVEVQPRRLAALKVTIREVEDALIGANIGGSGGYLESHAEERLVRHLGRAATADVLLQTALHTGGGLPVPLSQVAEIFTGERPARGDAGVDGRPAVILSIQKQPHVGTVPLTRELHTALDELQAGLPAGVKLQPLFEQSRFIEAAIHNVEEALRDGAILVLIVLALFLMNWRTTAITLTAIPLSFVTAAVALHALGFGIDTMALGGIAIAIGELVDDAIVDVENVFRRLRENRLAAMPRSPLAVVLSASREVRNAIVYATVLVVLVFLPLFAMGGVEGQLFRPLGLAYIISILASFVVSLTVTPVLCSFLLPADRSRSAHDETPFVKWIKQLDRRALEGVLSRPGPLLAIAAILVLAAAAAVPFMGREFLPAFQEGTATITLDSRPGISLAESARIGTLAEQLLRQVPEVIATGRRTGRAELDEHAEGVHHNELEVDFRPSKRSREEILDACRARLAVLPGVYVGVGQPIAHRLDHLLSGVRAQVAVKLHGPDLAILRAKAAEIEGVLAGVEGVVDLQTEAQVELSQVRVTPDRAALARLGLDVRDLDEALAVAMGNHVVTQLLDGPRRIDVALAYDSTARTDPDALRETLLPVPGGVAVPFSRVADVAIAGGPNQVLHEDGQRRIAVSANVSGRDLSATVEEIRERVRRQVQLPPGYFIRFGGQFEAQESATRTLLVLGLLALLAMFAVLWGHFRSSVLVLQILLNVPLALVGSVIAVAISGGVLSVASLVGFITLTGIASRNTILMVSHYLHLMHAEGVPFGRDLVVRGSLERLVPVLMTAGAAALALVPLAFAGGAPGKEILQPVAVVILGGLVSSTLLDALVTPAVFLRFGRRAAQGWLARERAKGGDR